MSMALANMPAIPDVCSFGSGVVSARRRSNVRAARRSPAPNGLPELASTCGGDTVGSLPDLEDLEGVGLGGGGAIGGGGGGGGTPPRGGGAGTFPREGETLIGGGVGVSSRVGRGGVTPTRGGVGRPSRVGRGGIPSTGGVSPRVGRGGVTPTGGVSPRVGRGGVTPIGGVSPRGGVTPGEVA